MKRILLPLLLAALFAANPAPAWEAAKVSSVEHSTFYRVNEETGLLETKKGKTGLNGGHYSDRLFNGDFTDYSYQKTAGAYIVVDLDDTFANGCYVTEVKIGHKGTTKYSLYYSADGTAWTAIAENLTAAGLRTFSVEKVSKKIKFVWATTDGWEQNLAEIEVWGVDPSVVECLHPDECLTEWEAVPGTANCTEYGIDQRLCTNCGRYFHRESLSMLPIGHEYETVLTERGTSLADGKGSNVCSRCGDAVIFDEPRDLTTLGGIYMEGVVQFSAASVSSVCHPEWGCGGADKLMDGTWTVGYNINWLANTLYHRDEYAQFDFAATIDLTSVEISVLNHDQIVEFYSVEGGEEILVGDWVVEKDSSSGAPDYQRKQVEFRGVSLSTLRIRIQDSVGYSGWWGGPCTTICECHPYGTVNGAGKSAAVRTRIIID